MRMIVIIAALISAFATASKAQLDPQGQVNRMLRRMQIEDQQRFEDRQRQRALDQQEQAYDRQKCLVQASESSDSIGLDGFQRNAPDRVSG